MMAPHSAPSSSSDSRHGSAISRPMLLYLARRQHVLPATSATRTWTLRTASSSQIDPPWPGFPHTLTIA